MVRVAVPSVPQARRRWLTIAVPLAGLLAASAGQAAPDLGKAKVAANGTPLAIQGAAVYTMGGSALTLELSTEPLPCTVYADFGRSLAPGERYLSMTFKPLLQPDGTTRWTLDPFEMAQQMPESDADLSKLVLLDTDASKPVRFKLGQPVLLPANSFFEKAEVKLDLSGEGTADGCGVRRGTFEGIKPRPQPGLKLTAAGRTFAVQGATLSAEDGELTISSSPLGCDGGNGTDLLVKIGVKPGDDGTHSIYASGDVLSAQHNTSAKHLAAAPATAPAAGEEVLALTVVPAKAKGETRTVKISGTFALSDVPVVLSGEVIALDCSAR